MKSIIILLCSFLIISFNSSTQARIKQGGKKVKITTLSGTTYKGRILSKTATNIEIQHINGYTIPISRDTIFMIELRKRGKAAFIRMGIGAGLIMGALYSIIIEGNRKESGFAKAEMDKPRPTVMLIVTLGGMTGGALIGAAIPYYEEADFDEIPDTKPGKLKPEIGLSIDRRGAVRLSMFLRF